MTSDSFIALQKSWELPLNRIFLSMRRISIGALICFGLALFFSLYNWLPLLNAQWSIIDDHEIVAVIGRNDRLPFRELPTALSKSEIFVDEGSQRFRPSYYSIRYLECSIWGKQPHLWYAARIALSVIFALTLTCLCVRIGGPILGFGFLFYELSRTYWTDIFARLGPAETYAVLGVCLIILGFLSATKSGWDAPPCIAIALGIIIAAGSKENFIILTVLPVWLLVSRKIRLSLGMKGLFCLVLADMGWIFFNVAKRVLDAGHDVYGNAVSFESRFGILRSLVTRSDFLYWIVLCLSLFIIVERATHRHSQLEPTLTTMKKYIWMMIALLALFSSQCIFYTQSWPRHVPSRYLFPGIPAKHMAIFLLLIIISTLLSLKMASRQQQIWIPQLCIAVCFLIAAIPNFSSNRIFAKNAASNSIAFTAKINSTMAYLRSHPSSALILNSHSIADYEPVYSIERYVRSFGLSNPIALKVNGYSSADLASEKQRFTFLLAARLERIQNFGERSLFVPLSKVDPKNTCFSLGISGPPLEKCVSIDQIWP